MLCGITPGGDGTYNAEGIMKISETLKTNTTLTSIRSGILQQPPLPRERQHPMTFDDA